MILYALEATGGHVIINALPNQVHDAARQINATKCVKIGVADKDMPIGLVMSTDNVLGGEFLEWMKNK